MLSPRRCTSVPRSSSARAWRSSASNNITATTTCASTTRRSSVCAACSARPSIGLYGPRAIGVLQAAPVEGGAPSTLHGVTRVRVAGHDGWLVSSDTIGIRGFDLFVAPANRHQGIARIMMDRILEICARSLFKHVFASCDPGNQNAQSLYRKLGFEKIGQFVPFHAPQIAK